METFFLDAIAASDPHPARPDSGQGRIRVERKVIPTSLSIDEKIVDDDDNSYPVTVTLRHLTEAEATPTQRLSNLGDGLFRSNLAEDDVPSMIKKSNGRNNPKEEVVKAKYVVGCDGAHSWTRKTLGEDFQMRGEMTDFIWGVLDIVPITDFRMKPPSPSFCSLPSLYYAMHAHDRNEQRISETDASFTAPRQELS
jgi:phenol 2-monooxygenase (NADPH)